MKKTIDPEIELSQLSLILPPWMSRPAKNVSIKLKKFMELRQLSKEDVVDELGISEVQLELILQGRLLPDYETCTRLCQWMFGKKVYREDRMIREYQKTDTRAWKKKSVTLRTATWQSVDRARKKFGNGMGISAFVDLCVTLVVQDNMVLTTLQKAADRLEEVRVTQILAECKPLREFLSGDLQLAHDVWKDDSVKAEEYVAPSPVQTICERDEWSEL